MSDTVSRETLGVFYILNCWQQDSPIINEIERIDTIPIGFLDVSVFSSKNVNEHNCQAWITIINS